MGVAPASGRVSGALPGAAVLPEPAVLAPLRRALTPVLASPWTLAVRAGPNLASLGVLRWDLREPQPEPRVADEAGLDARGRVLRAARAGRLLARGTGADDRGRGPEEGVPLDRPPLLGSRARRGRRHHPGDHRPRLLDALGDGRDVRPRVRVRLRARRRAARPGGGSASARRRGTTFVTETPSITVGEISAIGTDLPLTAGAGWLEPLFRTALVLSLSVGFAVAYPVDVLLVAFGGKEEMGNPAELAGGGRGRVGAG